MCVPSIDAKMHQAETLDDHEPDGGQQALGSDRHSRSWRQQAPWVPLFNPKLVDFIGKRVGNYQFSLQFYMYVDQLWVK